MAARARDEWRRNYERERRRSDLAYAEARKKYQREYMRRFYARKKLEPEWISRVREKKRIAERARRKSPLVRAKVRELRKKWYAKHGARWRREWLSRPGVRERQRENARSRRHDPRYRERYLERQRAYSKSHQYQKRRREWARAYRKTENGKRSEFRGRLRKYGISLEEYEILFEKQDGVCAVCKKRRARKVGSTLCVDHCHKSGQVRGLLCTWCNSLIGHACDDPEVLRAAAKYLEARRK